MIIIAIIAALLLTVRTIWMLMFAFPSERQRRISLREQLRASIIRRMLP